MAYLIKFLAKERQKMRNLIHFPIQLRNLISELKQATNELQQAIDKEKEDE